MTHEDSGHVAAPGPKAVAPLPAARAYYCARVSGESGDLVVQWPAGASRGDSFLAACESAAASSSGRPLPSRGAARALNNFSVGRARFALFSDGAEPGWARMIFRGGGCSCRGGPGDGGAMGGDGIGRGVDVEFGVCGDFSFM